MKIKVILMYSLFLFNKKRELLNSLKFILKLNSKIYVNYIPYSIYFIFINKYHFYFSEDMNLGAD
ncbi:hypothetical protein GCM10008908_09440 [Clostridium subterminale]|uniref:Uncharacterized protein n=1 Tax=Clostridium subterminale TaxID=1550 RepID=A0ABN1KJH8_CLOSU